MAAPPTLRRQLTQASRERQRRILDFRVERVLNLLKDENLAARAALDSNGKEGILLECNFIDAVWPRASASSTSAASWSSRSPMNSRLPAERSPVRRSVCGSDRADRMSLLTSGR